jgi:hypothetical protein
LSEALRLRNSSRSAVISFVRDCTLARAPELPEALAAVSAFGQSSNAAS